jgi:hypothetical protein
MDLGVGEGGVAGPPPLLQESDRKPVFLDVISFKSVFLRKIDCLRGFLVNIEAMEAQKREKTKTQGQFEPVLSIFDTFCNFFNILAFR